MRTPSRDQWVREYDEAWANAVAERGEPRPISPDDVDRACAALSEQGHCGYMTFWPGFANAQMYPDRKTALDADPECKTMFRIQYNGWGSGKERSIRRYVLHSIVDALPGPEADQDDGPASAAVGDYERGWLRLTDEVKAEIIRTLLEDDKQHGAITISRRLRDELFAEVIDDNARKDWGQGFERRNPNGLRYEGDQLRMFARVMDSLGVEDEGERDEYEIETDDIFNDWLSYTINYYKNDVSIKDGLGRYSALKEILDLSRGMAVAA